MLMNFIIVGFGGFLGSAARYAVYLVLGAGRPGEFPWPTFIINLAGCLAIGIASALVERAVPFHRHIYLAGMVGFLGAFTTFSAFGIEAYRLIESRQAVLAGFYAVASLVLGVLLVWAGRLIP